MENEYQVLLDGVSIPKASSVFTTRDDAEREIGYYRSEREYPPELGDFEIVEIGNDRIQHEIQMTDDPHYRAWYKTMRKQEFIDTYGIDED